MADIADARFAISDLVLTYAELIDLGDFEGLADLFTHAAVSVLLIIVALVAAGIPARRAVRVDPIVALRCE